jgi:spermidine synthase
VLQPRPPGAAARLTRSVLLLAVFLCAACGLVYELALLTLGDYLAGGGVRQTSLVLGLLVCSMGLGSLAAKPMLSRPLLAFALVEGALAVVGGLSVLVLYAAYAWLDLYTPAVLLTSVAVGTLIGAEVPLLMALLQRIRAQDAGEAVADLNAVDYLGALAGGLAFPFLLLPAFGQLRGALVTGAVNLLAAALVVAWLQARSGAGRHLRLSRRALAGLTVAGTVGAAALLATAVLAAQFEVTARQRLYRAPIVHAERSVYQEVVVTRTRPGLPDDVRLFLDGDLQFSSRDEHRYHEALVQPAMAEGAETVLVLGGGDGLALREVLRSDVHRVVEVELDPAVVRLAREDPAFRSLNRDSLRDPRVEVVVDDAMRWLREAPDRTGGEQFDVIVVDMPDPDDPATAKLYSTEFYGLAARLLAPGGRMVVQAGSPYFAPHAFWCIAETVRSAGLSVVPYHVDVPSFGDWGFVLAGHRPPGPLQLPATVADELRFLDQAVLDGATVFPRDAGPVDVEVSTLDRPRILDYERRGWVGY